MSGAHMSTDETNYNEKGSKKHPMTYTITRASWMSATLRKVCHKVDQENIKNWDLGTGAVSTGGNGPCTRHDMTPPCKADMAAPKGLWCNYYCSMWLTGLKHDQIHRLNIINEDFNLTIPTGNGEDQEMVEEFVQGSSQGV